MILLLSWWTSSTLFKSTFSN